MVSEEIEPREALDSVKTDSPSRARREVVRIFRDAADAEAGLFCKYGIGDDGRYYSTVEAVGSEPLSVSSRQAVSTVPIDRPGWNPENPPDDTLGAFRPIRHGGRDSSPGGRLLPIVRAFLEPSRVQYEARALLYKASEFLGVLSVFRAHERRFDSETLDALNSLVEPAIDVLAAANDRERELLGERPARILLEPKSLEIEGLTDNAEEWLNDTRREYLVGAIDTLPAETNLPTQLNANGFEVWLDELNGDLGRKYLVTIEYPERLELSLESALTPRQREVAGYAAAGATNQEIAETLGISADTVSDHLSEAYERLEVANRVELARTIEAGDE